jgi:hypothetical protein
VYNGELEGIALAFEYAATVALSSQEIRIHADNQAAIYRLRTLSDKPAQVWQLCCIRAANQAIQKGAAISLHWVPGHSHQVYPPRLSPTTPAPMLPSTAGESAGSSVFLWGLGRKLPVPSTSSRLAMDTTRHILPLLLHTKQGIVATLAFITRARVCTRKWHLGQEQDADV